MAVILLRLTFAMALIHRGTDPGRGFDDLRALRETCIKEQFALNMLSLMDIYLTLERAQQGDVDGAVERWSAIADEMAEAGKLSNMDVPLVFAAEQLLSRGDFDGAARAVDRLASLAADRQWGSRKIAVLKLRAELAAARGDQAEYSELRDQYREMADDLGFEGHIAWAAAMS
jgi:ATP/maltotriose-dependent transcriptional regulator MalT